MDALSMAWEHYRAGRYAEADEAGRSALRADPEDPAAWHLLGRVASRRERLEEAERNYRRALAARPDFAAVHGDLGVVLAARGRLEEAVACLRRALALAPDSVECQNHLGMALFHLGRPDEAAVSLRQAIACDPDHPMAPSALGYLLSSRGKYAEMAEVFGALARLRPAHLVARLRLGEALANLGELDEAQTCFEAARALAPDSPEAHLGLGLVRIGLRRFEAALDPLGRAIELAPDRPEAQVMLARALGGLGRFDEALAAAERAVRLRPDDARAHCQRGYLLDEVRRRDEAVASYEQAIRLDPRDPEMHHNLGVILGKLARYEEAIASFDEALRLLPDYPEARRNRALAWLTLGEFQRGWADLEWNWERRGFAGLSQSRPLRLSQPLWKGEPLGGRTILLHEDQGLGDTLQFIRYASLVRARGGRVVVQCQQPLVRLLETCPGIDRVIARGEDLPPFDVHSSLVRLIGLFTKGLDGIPASIPYLRAVDELVDRWRARLAAWPGFRVGITWQGNPKHTRDRDRSFRLIEFERLAGIEGVRLISLQKGYGAEQLHDLGGRFPVIDLGAELDPELATMQDTPAVMMGLDLLITPDTGLAHLAGALGRPVWIALPKAPDWRWFLGREESPWYPTARLFRQSEQGCWGPVFDRLAAALEEKIATARTPADPYPHPRGR
jgi:Flp pilus assembly protein TadD